MDEAKEKNEVLRRPQGMPLHWVYFIFYGLSMAAALWQHGEPSLTIILLSLVFPAALLIYVPYSIFGPLARHWMQIAIMILSACWGVYRCTQQVPIDKVLIETVCVMGFGFAFTLRAAEYSYIMLLGILLLVYGALIPRASYILLLPLAVFCGVLIMYHSRTIALAEDMRVIIPKGIFRHNWLHISAHVILSFIIFIVIYFSLPVTPKPGKGAIEVSFRNENENIFSQDVGKWVRSEHLKRGRNATKTLTGEKPDSLGKEGKIVSGPSGESMHPDGQGAGQPGNEIVFRAKSPVKLYWLGQLYDVYDGLKWNSSNRMKNQNNAWNPDIWKYSRKIEQKIIMEKWISSILFASYETSYVNVPALYSDKINKNFYQTRFIEGVPLPAIPFTYNALCNMIVSDNIPDAEKIKSLWTEKIPQAYYTKLPDKKISLRVKALASSVTASASSDYEKAIALRDYLRKNYAYKQFSKKTPEKAEPVDHFLFELKEGHCEYFASALTVLARLNGLPARVATGFSPGDYNVLDNCFEVYEYHAHAWAQIFIEGKGWLTFDAVPPGNIQSRTVPLAIGKFHDPFGDEWKVTPPELTDDVRNFFKEEAELESAAADEEEFTKKLPPSIKVMVMLATLPEKVGAFVDEAKEKYLKKSPNEKLKMQDIMKLITANLKIAFAKITGAIISFSKWLISANGIITCLIIAVSVLIFNILKYLSIVLKRKLKLLRCLKMYKAVALKIDDDPEAVVKLCYRICREFIALAKLPRRNNMELFAYAGSLKKIDKELARNFLSVCDLYCKSVYGEYTVSSQEAASSFACTGKVREALLCRINVGGSTWKQQTKI